MDTSKKNIRFEIPARAFINAQIIQQVRSTRDFENGIKRVLSMDAYKSQGLTEYQYENPAYLASLLYCLIVVPKELWADSPTSPVYNSIVKHNPLNFFKIAKQLDKDKRTPVYRLIYRLRNSVSHANFSVDTQLNFSFWDMPPGKAYTEWEAAIDADRLMQFLTLIGSTLANEGLAYSCS